MTEPKGRSAGAAARAGGERLVALDLWRGLVVLIMALDHANFFLGRHPDMEMPGRNQPHFANVAAWFTRFITHTCAPSFVFLAGAAVVLLAAARRQRGQSQWLVGGHLLLRGALLVVLEYTVVKKGWGMPFDVFQVIACLGACLALGSVLRFLPGSIALFLGLVLLFGHPLLADPAVVPAVASLPQSWRQFLLEPKLFTRWPVLYPILPWLSVFLLGAAFGRGLLRNRELTLRVSGLLGLAAIAAFVTLRLTDGFGDLVQGWTDDRVGALGNLTPQMRSRGWMGFFAMSKYPPAADFILWNLGLGLLFCWLSHWRGLGRGRGAAVLLWPGRAALFFYLVHLFVYRWFGDHVLAENGGFLTRGIPAAWLGWLMGLPLLLPLCWAFGRLKRRFPGFPLDLL